MFSVPIFRITLHTTFSMKMNIKTENANKQNSQWENHRHDNDDNEIIYKWQTEKTQNKMAKMSQEKKIQTKKNK